MIRVIHIVERLHQNAIENWLVRAFFESSRRSEDVHWGFYCDSGQAGRWDQRLREAGADVFYSPFRPTKAKYMQALRRTIKAGSFNVMHCHGDIMSAFPLLASVGLALDRRVLHVHNASQRLPTPKRWKQRLLREPMRRTCLQLADRIVGISHHTLATFLKNKPPRVGHDVILPCGTDTRPFTAEPDPAEFRHSLDFPASARILLFVGRMIPYKNPLFVLDMLADLAKLDSSVVACFIGTGLLESELENAAKQKSLLDRIRLLGWRDDIARIMKVSDLLVFPNIEETKEGLGLAVVEAQAAGLPMVLSLGATEEAVVVPELSHVVPLSRGPKGWARRAAEILSSPSPDRQACLRKVERSHLSLTSSVSGLMALYQN
ncbi:MAG: glycosyltransferase [Pirellulaceae bacterium]|nr:glycosyltransferase [Pirellulaceae bacterium]